MYTEHSFPIRFISNSSRFGGLAPPKSPATSWGVFAPQTPPMAALAPRVSRRNLLLRRQNPSSFVLAPWTHSNGIFLIRLFVDNRRIANECSVYIYIYTSVCTCFLAFFIFWVIWQLGTSSGLQHTREATQDLVGHANRF